LTATGGTARTLVQGLPHFEWVSGRYARPAFTAEGGNRLPAAAGPIRSVRRSEPIPQWTPDDPTTRGHGSEVAYDLRILRW